MSNTAIVLSIVSGIFVYAVWRASTHRYPPGPRLWPVIGNFFAMPTDRPWLQFTEWKDTYGDLVYLRIFGHSLLVVNSIDAIHELFEKRSPNYSDRPRRTMAELCGFGRTLALRNDDHTVRISRKFLHGELNRRSMLEYEPDLEANARKMCIATIRRPHAFRENIRMMAVANIMKIACGNADDSKDSALLVTTAKEVMQYLGMAMTTHKFAVDALPFLKMLPPWFPGTSFQRTAAASRDTLRRLYDLPFDMVTKQIQSGTAVPSLIYNALINSNLSEAEREILKHTAGEMYGAGTDTNVSIISSFFLAMTRYPDIQRRGREEIVSIIGTDRLPRVSDRAKLPFTEAILKECFRWNPSVPVAGHSSRKADVYRGYHIPARTLVIANAWGFTHNPEWYPDSMKFDPDRYFRDPKPPNPTQFTFGFGRRSCPGSLLAESTVFIAISTMLSTCVIAPHIKNDHGELPEIRYSTGAFSHPAAFECRVSVISDDAARLLETSTKFGGPQSSLFVVPTELIIE